MNKDDIFLAALAASGGVQKHTPVQIQKLMFLIDRNIAEKIGGPFFNFRPYDYGPFDADVYSTASQLADKGLVAITRTSSGWLEYGLTENSIEEANGKLRLLSEETQRYLVELSRFVRSLSFKDLVSTVYKAYPDMKVNSIFRG